MDVRHASVLPLSPLLPLVLWCCDDAVAPAEPELGDEIVFVSTRVGATSETGSAWDDLYRMNTEGTGVMRLSEVSDRYRGLQPSPDGSQVVLYNTVSGCYDLWVMDLDTRQLTQLTGVAGYERCNSHGWWSPGGDRIAFLTSRNVGEGRGWDVYVMGADGSDPHDVTANPSTDAVRRNDYTWGWSPDGRVVLESMRDGEPRTYLAAADGSGVELLFGEGRHFYPRWSPDGTWVLAEVRAGNASEAVVASSDGADPIPLGEGTSISSTATDPWSPDGTLVAFHRGNEILVVAPTGGAAVNVSRSEGSDAFQGWTPDGRILFSSDRTGDAELYVVNADGTGLVNLTNAPGSDEGPAVWMSRR